MRDILQSDRRRAYLCFAFHSASQKEAAREERMLQNKWYFFDLTLIPPSMSIEQANIYAHGVNGSKPFCVRVALVTLSDMHIHSYQLMHLT